MQLSGILFKFERKLFLGNFEKVRTFCEFVKDQIWEIVVINILQLIFFFLTSMKSIDLFLEKMTLLWGLFIWKNCIIEIVWLVCYMFTLE